jgi:hypothetical protein
MEPAKYHVHPFFICAVGGKQTDTRVQVGSTGESKAEMGVRGTYDGSTLTKLFTENVSGTVSVIPRKDGGIPTLLLSSV